MYFTTLIMWTHRHFASVFFNHVMSMAKFYFWIKMKRAHIYIPSNEDFINVYD